MNAGRKNFWNAQGRCVVFMLAATSIACLLFDFYGLCPMRTFTIFIFLPAIVLLFAFAVWDKIFGNKNLWRAVMIGMIAGFLAAIAYDVFRLPFVFAKDLHIESIVPPLKLFKVFPRFGAMILNQPLEQNTYPLAAHLVGWGYHFSNGIAFGVMYVALIGDGAKRHWVWGVLMAVCLELGMLLTPYSEFFKIPVTSVFVGVTFAAHIIFGAAMGKIVQHASKRIFISPFPIAGA